MVLTALSIALASEGDTGVQLGAELRLDAGLHRVDRWAYGGSPELGFGVSRAALFFAAEPTDRADVFMVADIRSAAPVLLEADDGSLVSVPAGFEAQILDARIQHAGVHWEGSLGRMPSLLGLDDKNQSQWGARSPYFYVPGVRPSQTPMRRLGLVPERVMAVRLTLGTYSRYPQIDVQGGLSGGMPLVEARGTYRVLPSLLLTASSRVQAGRWAWSGAALWTGWSTSVLVMGFGEDDALGAAIRGTARVGSFVITGEGTAWGAFGALSWGAVGGLELKHSEQLSTGMFWEMRVPSDVSLAIEHDVGLQLKTWF